MKVKGGSRNTDPYTLTSATDGGAHHTQKHQVLVLQPRCIPEKAGVIQKGI
jgi:hypothetical protein